MHRIFLLFLVLALIAGCALSRPARDPGATLPLYLSDGGRPFQASSHHPTEGDAWHVQPGETKVLAELEGPAIINNIWFTMAGAHGPDHRVDLLRKMTLRIYWDGEESPSVEVPFGDFFGCGFGQYTTINTPWVNANSRGYTCYFPMPFRKSARIEIENGGAARAIVFFHFLGTRYESLPPDTLYFHSQWRRENPPEMGRNVTILEAEGRGYFAGSQFFVQGYTKGDKSNFMEGDEWIYIDGEEEASIKGTGGEDYYQGAWYFIDGPFQSDYYGLSYRDPEQVRYGCYRFHTRDRIPFEKSIRVEIEHGQRIYNEAKADYSVLAYWYQTEPHKPFAPISRDREPIEIAPAFLIPGAVEFEGTPGTHPYFVCTYYGGWSNDMAARTVGWTKPGDALEKTFQIETAGDYRFTGHYIGQDHGPLLQLEVNGEALGEPVDTYAEDPLDAYLLCRNRPLGPRVHGERRLEPGEHTLRLVATGKRESSKGFQAIVDCVAVVPVP